MKQVLHTCCFIGHRTINGTEDLKAQLHAMIKTLIAEQTVNTFLFGSGSRFCVFYYHEACAPTTRKSGTKSALEYALKRQKIIFQLP